MKFIKKIFKYFNIFQPDLVLIEDFNLYDVYLIKLLKNNIEECFNTTHYKGLCGVAEYLWNTNKITSLELTNLRKLINSFSIIRDLPLSDVYFFTPKLIEPRKKWCDEVIKILSKKVIIIKN